MKRKESFEELKKNLASVKSNLYVNKSDPSYYEKIIRHVNPQSPEAHYHLALKFKEAGNLDKALHHFKEATKTSSSYYLRARSEVAATKEVIHRQRYIDEYGVEPPKKFSFWKSLWVVACILGIIMNSALIYLIVKNDIVEASSSIIHNNDTNNTVATVNSDEELHLMNTEQISMSESLLQVGANMVRGAIKAYIAEYGGPPENIEQLTESYPNNYLSFIPNEAITLSNKVTEDYNGTGGWVYDPEAEDIESMFFPNIGCPNCVDEGNDLMAYPSQTPYEPIEVLVSKEDHQLLLMSGQQVIAVKDVGLGKDDRTPATTLTVTDRVLEPKGNNPDVYGVAALGMGQYAIHGTYVEESISANESLGCIRMRNEDIMELYHLVPTGTSVHIQTEPFEHLNNPIETEKLIPSDINHDNQIAEDKVFHWLH